MVVAVAESAPVRSTFTNTRAGKALVRRFVAGDISGRRDCDSKDLNRQGMKVSLDLLGEEVHSAEEVESALAGVCRLPRRDRRQLDRRECLDQADPARTCLRS